MSVLGDRNAAPRTVIIACSVLRDEVEALRPRVGGHVAADYVDSALHLHPDALARALSDLLKTHRDEHTRTVLVIGDCHATMATCEAAGEVARTRGRNCCELLLGTNEFRRLSREGAFFVLPEWAERWREILAPVLGPSAAGARQMMQELHTRLVYLDTGVRPTPCAALEALSEYVGLPLEIVAVSLDTLLARIEEAQRRVNGTAQ